MAEIKKQYNKPNKIKFKKDEYSVTFDIEYSITTENKAVEISKENMHPDLHFVRIENSPLRSFYSLEENSGFFSTKDDLGESTTAPHELGHGYGLEHSEFDQRGKGVPDIMCARGTLVDAIYQYDPKVKAGDKGGTVNPRKRRVTTKNIEDILNKIDFDEKGRGQTNNVSNIIFDKDGNIKK